MDAERERRRLQIFSELVGLPPAECAEALDRSCAGDEELRAGVEELLRWDREPHAIDASFVATAHVLAVTEDPLRPGLRIGPYTIEGKVGAGGMGTVYRARRADIGLVVAIKVLHAGVLRIGQLARFQNEAKILARLQHPGIARVVDAGIHREHGASLELALPYLVMEFVDGADLLTHARSLPLAARLALMAKLCDAVQAGHRSGVVHGDLKPDNVLVDHTGQPRVIDFGIATLRPERVTSSVHLAQVTPALGTIPYCSPERLRGGDDIDTRADVYALGVMLYQLVTDRLPIPIDGKPTARDIARLCAEAPAPPSAHRAGLARDLDWIVLKALAIDPDERYQSAAAVADDLRNLAADLPVSVTPPSRLRELQRALQRRRGVLFAFAAVAAASTIGLVATAIQAERVRDEAARAERALGVMRDTTELVVSRLDEAMLRPRASAREQRENLLAGLLEPLATAQREASAAWPTRQAVAALVTLTELALAKGDLELAATNGAAAFAAAEGLQRLAPGADALAWLGAAHCMQSTVATRRADSAAAATAARAAVAACERAAADGSLPGRLWLVRGQERLASCLLDAGELDVAIALRESAVASRRSLLAAGHCQATDLGDSLLGLALALDRRGDAAQTTVLAEVVALHGDADVDALDTAAAKQVATARQRLGQRAIGSGDFESGLAQVAEAVAIHTRLHAADPGDRRAARAHVEALRAQVFANRRAGRHQASLVAAEHGLATARHLVAAAPDDTEGRGLLVSLLADTAESLRQLRRDGTMLLAEAIARLEQMWAEDPQEKHQNAAATLSRLLAEGLRSSGRFHASLVAAESSVAIRRAQRVRAPGDLEVRSRLVASLQTLARTQLDSGRLPEARAHLVEAADLLHELRRSQPDNDLHRRSAASGALQLGYVESEARRDDAARESFAAACASCRERLAAHPGDAQALAMLAQALQALASAQAADGDPLPLLMEAAQLRQRLGGVADIAHAHERLAVAHVRAGRIDAAGDALRAAIGRLGERPDELRTRARLQSAAAGLAFVVERRTADARQALALADCLSTVGWADQAVPCYERAFAAGELANDADALLRGACAAGRAARQDPALATAAFAWLRQAVGSWRQRLAAPDVTAAERDVVLERLREVRADEFALLPLRIRPEWLEVFPEAAN